MAALIFTPRNNSPPTMERLSDKQKWECSEHDQKEWICATDGERFFHMKRYGWDNPEKSNEEQKSTEIKIINLPIILTPEQSLLIKSYGNMVEGDKKENWYYLPYWFKEIGENAFEIVLFEKLPDYVKDTINSHRNPEP